MISITICGTSPHNFKTVDFVSLKPRDFDQRPLLVIWEMTQACDLKCAHCRANSRPHRHPLELSTAEACHLIDQITEMKVPLFVLTEGDPLKRADLLPIVQYAHKRGLRTSLTPSTTPLLVRDAIFELKQSGLMRLAVSFDGSTAGLHDGFRGVPGSYKRSLDAIAWCHEADLPVQVNTTVSRRNFADLDNGFCPCRQATCCGSRWRKSIRMPHCSVHCAIVLSSKENAAAANSMKFAEAPGHGPSRSARIRLRKNGLA